MDRNKSSRNRQCQRRQIGALAAEGEKTDVPASTWTMKNNLSSELAELNKVAEVKGVDKALQTARASRSLRGAVELTEYDREIKELIQKYFQILVEVSGAVILTWAVRLSLKVRHDHGCPGPCCPQSW